MSDYSYTDKDGDKLAVNTSIDPENVFVGITEKNGQHTAVHVLRADVPTVAAAFLKAAGQEATILPKATMKVAEWPHSQIRCGDVTVNAHTDPEYLRSTAARYVNDAANYIALAEYIENKESREAEATKKLHERRNAIAREIMRNDDNLPVSDYASLNWYAQKAVDRIIELEDARA